MAAPGQVLAPGTCAPEREATGQRGEPADPAVLRGPVRTRRGRGHGDRSRDAPRQVLTPRTGAPERHPDGQPGKPPAGARGPDRCRARLHRHDRREGAARGGRGPDRPQRNGASAGRPRGPRATRTGARDAENAVRAVQDVDEARQCQGRVAPGQVGRHARRGRSGPIAVHVASCKSCPRPGKVPRTRRKLGIAGRFGPLLRHSLECA
jgi:hypothetical protein